MKQLLLVSLFLFISLRAFSQDVTVDPNPYVGDFAVDLNEPFVEVVAHAFMTNNTAQTIRVKWVIVRGDSCPGEWGLLVCDKNQCYTAAVISNQGGPVNIPVVLAAGEKAILDYHIQPSQVEKCCVPQIEIRNYDNPSVLYQTVDFEVCINQATAITEKEKANLKVFPNPTSNQFSITENSFIKHVWVSNILGKRVKTFRTSNGNNFDISNLPDGIYLVSMVDDYNKVLKTVRISKRGIRP